MNHEVGGRHPREDLRDDLKVLWEFIWGLPKFRIFFGCPHNKQYNYNVSGFILPVLGNYHLGTL